MRGPLPSTSHQTRIPVPPRPTPTPTPSPLPPRPGRVRPRLPVGALPHRHRLPVRPRARDGDGHLLSGLHGRIRDRPRPGRRPHPVRRVALVHGGNSSDGRAAIIMTVLEVPDQPAHAVVEGTGLRLARGTVSTSGAAEAQEWPAKQRCACACASVGAARNPQAGPRCGAQSSSRWNQYPGARRSCA